jgi:hypothetical protein
MSHFCKILLFVVIFSSCNEATKKTDTTQDSQINDILLIDSIDPEKFNNTALNTYVEFVQRLDTTEVASSLKAVEGLGKYLTGESDRVADTAFVIFRTLYDKLKLNLNIKHANDTTNFSPLMIGDNLQPTGKQLEYISKLEKNGFKITTEEGMSYIDQDWTFVDKHFSALVTKTMKSYIRQFSAENTEKAFSDGAFLLGPTRYIDRLIWYEKFIYENPGFLYITECKNTQRTYMTFLFYGMDNTPLLEDDALSAYFTEAYDYLQQKYPATKTAQRAKPYFIALQQKQLKKAETILEQYRRESVITNYGE